jgi:hypothetical protein
MSAAENKFHPRRLKMRGLLGCGIILEFGCWFDTRTNHRDPKGGRNGGGSTQSKVWIGFFLEKDPGWIAGKSEYCPSLVSSYNFE